MNELDLERELRTLRPATPSRRLEAGIARDLAGGERTAKLPRDRQAVPWMSVWLDRLMWSGLGAAAVLALMISQRTPSAPATNAAHPPPQEVAHQSAPLDSSALQPVLAGVEDMGWHEEGVRFDSHGRPMLKLTRTAIERRAWADPRNAGVIQMETPRQEVLWMPVTLH